MPSWWKTATPEQRAAHRAGVSRGQKLAWKRGRCPIPRHAPGRVATVAKLLAAHGLGAECARFYFAARDVFGGHNPSWLRTKIIAPLKWWSRLYGTGDDSYKAWHYYLFASHRIEQHARLRPQYRDRLKAIDARFKTLFPEGKPPTPPKYAFANNSRYAYGRPLWEHISEERRAVIVEKLGGSEDEARRVMCAGPEVIRFIATSRRGLSRAALSSEAKRWIGYWSAICRITLGLASRSSRSPRSADADALGETTVLHL
jgi:hypothetical protein